MAASVRIVTQARLGSSRLPGKILKTINGRTLLDYHLERLAKTGYPIVVATTDQDSDKALVEDLKKKKIDYFCGSENDVLDRYQQTIKAFPADIIVRVTSDCPLVDGALIVEAVKKYQKLNEPRLYLSNAIYRSFPRGFDFEIFSKEMLEEAAKNAKDPQDREHVTAYFYRHKKLAFKHHHWENKENFSSYRVTVDEAADFELVKELIEKHQADKKSWREIVSILQENSELVKINQHVEQKKISGVSFRHATDLDSKKLFFWRNDPETRAQSVQPGEVSLDQHNQWFSKSLQDENRQIWIAVADNKDVGMVRADRQGGMAELSWSVAPEHRGRGLGSLILRTYVKEHPGKYFARIKKLNEASLKMAANAGFKKVQEEKELFILQN